MAALVFAAQKDDPITLNTDASKQFAELEDAKADLVKRYNEIVSFQAAIRLGAGIPNDWTCAKAATGVQCAKPKVAPTPK